MTEPISTDEALKSLEWKNDMNEEFEALKKNNTWSLLPLQPLMNKWVFMIKRNMNGSFQKCKARLVLKDFHQNAGFGYGETSNLVVKASTVTIILIIIVTEGWKVRQLDINNAFLNDDL